MRRKKSGVQSTEKTTHRRRRWLIALVIIVGLTALFAHSISAPVHGKIVPVDVTKQKAQHPKSAPVLPAGATQSDYFQIALPTGYRIQAGNAAVPGLLYQQTLIKASSFGSLIIAIAIKNLPEGGVSGDSSYATRSQQPSRYHLTTQNVQGDLVSITNDSQSAAVVAFWPHGSYLATIGITAGISDPGASDNKDELDALQPLLAGWQWR